MKITRKNLNRGILVAGAPLITTTCSACGFEDNLYTMFEQTGITQHVKLEPGWKKVDVKTIIENSIECTPNSKKLFEEIASNEVGRLALRAFYQGQRKLGKKLRIVEDKSYINKNGFEQTNIFAYKDFAIYLDLEQLQGVTTVGYCNGQIVEKEETAINILFHEFVHAIHYVTDDEKTDTSQTLEHLYGEISDKYLWSCKAVPENEASEGSDGEDIEIDDEEIYTIVGLFLRDGKIQFNPINSALFEFSRQFKAGIPISKITYRIYHCLYKHILNEEISMDTLNKIDKKLQPNFRKICVDGVS